MLCDNLEGWNGGEVQEGDVCILSADLCCCMAETNNIVKQYHIIKNKFKKKTSHLSSQFYDGLASTNFTFPKEILMSQLNQGLLMGFPSGSDGKESACSAGDLGLIFGSGRSPGEGNGNPL